MEIRLKYGSSYVTLPSNSITELTQEANLFLGESFYIGSTVCRSFKLGVDKNSLNSLPDNSVLIYEGSTKYADLVIDNIDDEDVRSYKFTLTDRMVRLNEQDSSWFTSGRTIQQLLSAICTQYGIAGVDTIAAYGNLAITWYDNWTARDFVSWVAELLGGYAYISANNYLKFSTYSNTPVQTIPVANCDSFKLGEQITIDRVVYDTPGKTVKYPSDYSGTGCTLYLNTENALFTDSGNVTIENQVGYIYNVINGFSFYNVKVGKCPINGSIRAGQCIAFTLNNVTYKTIAQVNWNYNSMWLGGYELELDSPVQAETQIINSAKKTFAIVQRIDREVGEISSTVSSVETKVDSSINHISYLYGYGDSATQQPGDGAFTYSNMPPLVSGKYIWRMSLAYTNENPTSNPTKTYEMIQGAQGAQGEPGQGEPGADGYNSATIYLYKRAASTPSKPAATSYTFSTHSLSSVPSGWSVTVPSGTNPLYVSTVSVSSQSDTVSIASSAWSTPQIMASNGTNGTNGTSYYTHIRYSANSDGSSMTSSPQANTKYIGVYTGTSSTAPTTASSYTWSKYVGDSVTIASIQYAASSSGVFPAPTSGWQSSPPTVAAGNYLWTKVNYSSGDPSYSVSYQGKNGTNGTNGDDGVSVTGIDNLYYLKNARLDIVPNGNTTQKTMSGKNLLDVSSIPQGLWDGITRTISDGVITLNGTATKNTYMSIRDTGYADGTYTFSFNNPVICNTLRVSFRRADETYFGDNPASSVNRTITVTGEPNDIVMYVASGTTLNNFKFSPQLELGSSATAYEPYCGGIPSPNPDYPQEIHSVSGDNQIKVVGKNIFSEEFEKYSNYSKITYNGDYTITAPEHLSSGVRVNVTTKSTSYAVICSTVASCAEIRQILLENPNTKYTISCDVYCSASFNFGLSIRHSNGSNTIVDFSTVSTQANKTVRVHNVGTTATVANNDQRLYINIAGLASGNYIEIGNFQLEKGETDTAYEPYRSHIYTVNLPVENLWDNSIVPLQLHNATYDNGVITFPPLTTSVNQIIVPYTLKVGETYSVSFDAYTDSGTSDMVFDGLPDSVTSSGHFNDIHFTATTTRTRFKYENQVVPDGLERLRFFRTGTPTNTVYISNIQLEVGSKANAYNPYGSPSIELNGLSTYKDYIHKENGKWWVHKAIGTIVLDGSENWGIASSAMAGTQRFYYNANRYYNDGEAGGNNIYVISNKFKGVGWIDIYSTDRTTKDAISLYGNTSLTGRLNLRIDETLASTVEELKTWLASNNVQVVHVLATPTETEITETALVAQLDNLALAISYDGGTNLVQTNSDNQFILTYNTNALTRPNKPTAEVTTSSNLPEVWSLQPATFINGYRYYNSLQVHYDNNTLTWTDVVEDSSMTYVSQQVSSMNTDIVQNAEAIALKADRSTVDTSISSLNNRVGKVESASAEMVVKADGITTTISTIEENLTDNYYTKEEITQIVDDTSASHTRTFATKTEVNGVSTEVHTMIRQSGDGIDLGKSDSDFIGHLDNDSLDFNNTSTDTTVAWVDANDGLGGKELSVGDFKQQSNRWRIFTRQSGSHLTFTRHS